MMQQNTASSQIAMPAMRTRCKLELSFSPIILKTKKKFSGTVVYSATTKNLGDSLNLIFCFHARHAATRYPFHRRLKNRQLVQRLVTRPHQSIPRGFYRSL